MLEQISPNPINRYASPYGDYRAPVGETYDYWKDELRSLGQSKDFASFSSVLDRTTWTVASYEIGTGSFQLLHRAMEHVRRLRERGVENWKLEAFADVLTPALRDAYLQETLYRICRRAGLTASEASRRARRGFDEALANLSDAYRDMGSALA